MQSDISVSFLFFVFGFVSWIDVFCVLNVNLFVTNAYWFYFPCSNAFQNRVEFFFLELRKLNVNCVESRVIARHILLYLGKTHFIPIRFLFMLEFLCTRMIYEIWTTVANTFISFISCSQFILYLLFHFVHLFC